MRPLAPVPASLGRMVRALVVLGALAAPAAAQVTVNPGALDLLPQQPAARPAPGARPAARPHGRAATERPQARPGQTPATTPSTPVPAAPTVRAGPVPAAPAAPPTVPTVPPAIAALPPPAPLLPTRPLPPPVVPVAADAPGTAAPFGTGLRVTFGADRQDLNPTTEAALRELARRIRGNEATTVNIYAYAVGTAEDPSIARRLSLARALAARAVLITEGIASTRIYPRAVGAAGGDTAPDRVDVVPGSPGPPSAAAATQPAAAAPIAATPPAATPTAVTPASATPAAARPARSR